MSNTSFQFIVLRACILLSVGFCTLARAQDAVVLRNDVWSVAISPRTLRVVGTPVGRAGDGDLRGAGGVGDCKARVG